jgi:hypothetical protein
MTQDNNFCCLFDEKYREDYRQEKTAPTDPNHSFDSLESPRLPHSPSTGNTAAGKTSTPGNAAMPALYGYPISTYIRALLPNGVAVNSRHAEALKLANDLMIMLDGNRQQVHQVLLSQQWVQDIMAERSANEIDRIVDAALKHMQKREEENLYTPWPTKRMCKVIETVTGKSYRKLMAEQNSPKGLSRSREEEALELTERIGMEIEKLFRYYPLLRLLCHGMKRKHYVAAMFAGGAMAMTLMTRCWYSFFASPGRRCRMNCIMELVGPPGSGKSFVVDLYRIMMEPVKMADKKQVDALNKWNEEQNTKGANKDKSARPIGAYRCLPAESSVAAIREAIMDAKEEIDGETWPMHVFLFDSELDNTIRQMKKGYMDITTLYLKAFHNENHGVYLKSTTSKVGDFDVYMNCVYTGTQYALDKQVNVDSYNTGLHFRLTLVPMAYTNYEMMEYRPYTDKDAQRDKELKEWAYKLDSTKGEIPVKMLSDKLCQWTANRMQDAREDDSKIDEDLLKRCAWHGINYAIPFVVSRHWNQMTLDNGRWTPGVGFKLDKTDWKLCQLIVNAHFAFQRYFVGPVAEKFYDNETINQTSLHHHQSRTRQAYLNLPDIFTMEDVIRCFGLNGQGSGCSRLKRLQDDGLAEKIRSGQDKGKYRKLA